MLELLASTSSNLVCTSLYVQYVQGGPYTSVPFIFKFLSAIVRHEEVIQIQNVILTSVFVLNIHKHCSEMYPIRNRERYVF